MTDLFKLFRSQLPNLIRNISLINTHLQVSHIPYWYNSNHHKDFVKQAIFGAIADNGSFAWTF